MEHIEQERVNENQGSLFDVFAGDEAQNIQQINLDSYPEFTLKEQLTLEKQAIGYYLTASLFDEYHDIAKKLEIMPLSKFNTEDEDIQEIINARYAKLKPKVLIAGIINYMGSRPTRKGGKIAFIRIEDASGELEFVVFNDEFEKYKHLFKIDELVFVEGEVIYDSFRNEVKVNASQVFQLDEVIQNRVSSVELSFNSQHDWNKIKTILQLSVDGSSSVKLNYANSHAECSLVLGDSARFSPNYANLEQLSDIVGKTHWRLQLNRV